VFVNALFTSFSKLRLFISALGVPTFVLSKIHKKLRQMVGIKKIVQTVITAVAFLTIVNIAEAQQISPMFFGQNGWMPDSTGTRFLNGKVHQTWDLIEESGVQSIRFGGISSDRDKPTNHQYLRMIDSIRAHGMEPIIQVSFWAGKYSAQEAGELVKFINVTSGRNIKYWSIGNEPDHGSSYKYTKAEQVSPYIKSFSRAMKAVDPSIKIIGPDCAWYNKSIIPPMVTPGNPNDVSGKSPEGHYYIDVISFHEYPFKGTQSREQVISTLTATGKFEDKLKDLNNRIAAANQAHGRIGGNELKIGVTEANIGYHDPKSDGPAGLGTESFIGGQFWIEMMGIAMRQGVDFINFWGVTNALGYLEKDTHKKRPTFHHFKMMADNFKGSVANAKTNRKDVKVFASKDGNQVAVIVMNQNNSQNFKFSLKLDNEAVTGSDAVKINVEAGIPVEYKDEAPAESTLLIVFDGAGNVIKKCEYTLKQHALKGLEPSCTDISSPAAIKITAPTSVICGGESLTMTIENPDGYALQWYRDGQAVDGAVGNSFITQKAGVFTVNAAKGKTNINSEPFKVVESTAPEAVITPDGSLNICTSLTVMLNASTGPEYTYEWSLNGTVIPEAIEAHFEAMVPGLYKVTVRNPCGMAVSQEVKVSSCDGVDETTTTLEETPVIHTYPNPNAGDFTVEMQADVMPGEVVTMDLINIAGQVVYTITPAQTNGYVRQNINLDSSTSPGMYIVRINAGKKFYTNKILVAR
jgi:hypothetical protein